MPHHGFLGGTEPTSWMKIKPPGHFEDAQVVLFQMWDACSPGIFSIIFQSCKKQLPISQRDSRKSRNFLLYSPWKRTWKMKWTNPKGDSELGNHHFEVLWWISNEWTETNLFGEGDLSTLCHRHWALIRFFEFILDLSWSPSRWHKKGFCLKSNHLYRSYIAGN